MPTTLSIDAFLATTGALLDVRTPAEFAQGHIPGALNLPLFTDAERVEVGTHYKQSGRQQAVRPPSEARARQTRGFAPRRLEQG